jgi:hypothetical protein
MCTKQRRALQTLGFGDAQVHISSDRPGTETGSLRSGIRELGPSQGEVFQRPLIKDQQGFHRRMHSVEPAAVVRVRASTDCEIASEGIESYVKLVARSKGVSARRWHHLTASLIDENLRSFKALAALPRINQPQIKR